MSHTSIFQEEFWLWQQVAYRQHAACNHLLGSTIHLNTVNIPGSIRGDILLSATYCQNQSRSRDKTPFTYHIHWQQLRPFHQDGWIWKTRSKHLPWKLSQFQNEFWHWVEILSCQSWVSKGLWLRFSICQSSTTNIFPNNHHNHRMQSFVIWGIQLGISQLHLGRPTARHGKSSGWKMILSFWDGLFLGAILVSEVITLNQIGKSR